MTDSEEHEWELTPEKLALLLASGTLIRLIDVREIHEYNHCKIDGAELMPMMALPTEIEKIGKEEHLIFY